MVAKLNVMFVIAALSAAPAALEAQTLVPGTNGLAAIGQQSYLDVISLLERTGYRVMSMKSTLLGRVRIRARNTDHLREVVVSRHTGEIKSDRIIMDFTEGGGGNSTTAASSAETKDESSPAASVSVGSGGVSASVGGVSVGIGN